VLLDSDLAAVYGVTTKAFNRAVRRNIDRFPADFLLQLTDDEAESSRSQTVTLKAGRGQHSKYPRWRSPNPVFVHDEETALPFDLLVGGGGELLHPDHELARQLGLLAAEEDSQLAWATPERREVFGLHVLEIDQDVRAWHRDRR
jgi:ORF6N domain